MMNILDKVFGKNKESKLDDAGKKKEGIPDELKLDVQPFYFGFQKEEDVKIFLVDSGDYLIRGNQLDGKISVILDVHTTKGLSSYALFFIDGQKKYGLRILIEEERRKNPSSNLSQVPRFDNVVELVSFYKNNPLPCGNRLKRAITKPKWLIKHNQIQYDPIEDKIASGNFGSVYRGYFTKDTGERIRAALKVCNQETTGKEDAAVKDKAAVKEEAAKAVAAREAMLHEARLMSDYKFENVIRFYGVACNHLPVMVVMEYCPGDSLENHLLADRGDTIIERILYCYEAARGMRYLHIQGCIHSDLASRNCLISADGIVKIADFGLSKFVDEMNPNAAKLKIPIRWMAPECFGRKAQIVQKSDVWAYGVLIYEVFNKGEMPWPDDKDFKAMAKRIRRGEMPELPDITPATIKALVSKCWIVDLEKRTTFDECYQFLSDYLSQNKKQFPKKKKLAINQISGVHRIYSFKEDAPNVRTIQRTTRRPTTTSTGTTSNDSNSRSRHCAIM